MRTNMNYVVGLFTVLLFCIIIVLLYRDLNNPLPQTFLLKTAIGDIVRIPKGKADMTNLKVAEKYPEIRLTDLSPGVGFQDISTAEAEERFFNFFSKIQVDCVNRKRIGDEGDGGWFMCNSAPYTPNKDDCVVYSIGTGQNWSFDDDMAVIYGCHVYAYDPTVDKPKYEREELVKFHNIGLYSFDGITDRGPVKTLATLFNENGHRDKIIDYLKIDIEGAEWVAFEQMLRDEVLKNVKQFSFEFHTPDLIYFDQKVGDTKQENFIQMLNILEGIESQGFKRYLTAENQAGAYRSKFTGQMRTCCWELYYINLRFVTS